MTSMHMEAKALLGRFVSRAVANDDVTIHPSRGSRINPILKVCEHNRVAHAFSYHKNGLVSGHQPVGKWFVFLFALLIRTYDETSSLSTACSSLCQDGICGWNHLAFICIVLHSQNCFRSCSAGSRIVYVKWCFVLHVQCCGSFMVSTE